MTDLTPTLSLVVMVTICYSLVLPLILCRPMSTQAAALRQTTGDALCDAQTEFTCDSGECVPLSKYNDHTQDCPDGSDEMDQTTESMKTCRSDGFTCKNSRCVPYTWVNDGSDDCEDGSDEAKKIGDDCSMVSGCCYCYEYVPNSECRQFDSQNGMHKICVCSSGFYNNSDGTQCIRRVVGDTCLGDADCADAFSNSHCSNNGLCTCDIGYYPSEDQSMCVRRLVSDSCLADIDCTMVIENSNCTENTCVCKPGYYHSPDRITCVKRNLGDTCLYGHDCEGSMAYSFCRKDASRPEASGVCRCSAGYRDNGLGSDCDVREIGEMCTSGYDCGVQFSVCLNHTCECLPGYQMSPRRDWCQRRRLGDSCLSDSECITSMHNTHCLANRCQCYIGFLEDLDRDGCYDRDRRDITIIAGSVFTIAFLALVNIFFVTVICAYFVL